MIVALAEWCVLHNYGASQHIVDGAVVVEGDEGEAHREQEHQQEVLHD